MGKNILVTGGAGYIGSHICKRVYQSNFVPIVIDNLSYGHTWAVKWGDFHQGNIHDNDILDYIFQRYQPVAVIHCAAFAFVGESVSDPGKYYRNNVNGTIALLDAMRRFSCSCIVFSSTCATYGLPEQCPISEQHPLRPINPYGRSKLMAERIIQDYQSAYGIKYTLLRYFNAAGADPDGEIGEVHDPEPHLIPLALQAITEQRTHLEIYGNDYPTPDGTAIRDYIHVTDLADAHVYALQRLLDNEASDCFNLGTGHGHSVLDVIKTIEQVTGHMVPVKQGPRRPGDPPILTAAAEKAHTVLHWRPQYCELTAIVETAWNWHQRYHSS